MKPKLKLTNVNGNAFSILGNATKVARKANWTSEKINEFTKKAMSGDYDHLIQVCIEYFDVY